MDSQWMVILILGGAGIITFLAATTVYPRLRITFKSKDTGAIFEGSRFRPPAPAHQQPEPSIESQTNITGSQYNAAGNLIHVEGDYIPGTPKESGGKPNEIGVPVGDSVGRQDEISRLLAACDVPV